MWLTPEQGTPIEYRRRIVCGSRKSIRSSASAITSAYFPSGVKYRLYGSGTGTGGAGAAGAGVIGGRAVPAGAVAYSPEPSPGRVAGFRPAATAGSPGALARARLI